MIGVTKEESKSLIFSSNASFQHFDQFRLCTVDQRLINAINYPSDETKKVKALILGCIQRNNKLLYKGLKYYTEDLQFILNRFPSIAPSMMKKFNIVLNKSESEVKIQCHYCANFTSVWKYCPTCQNVHYCHEGCEMKIKFTHQRQQCKIRPFPQTYKSLQVEIHVGSDIGKNVHLFFQHQVSMSLLLRGQKLLNNIMIFLNTPEGSAILDNYQAKNQNKMIKFQKEHKCPQVTQKKDPIHLQNMEEIFQIYTDNKILRGLETFLLENGGILWKNIRQIHDNHFREIFIFRYP